MFNLHLSLTLLPILLSLTTTAAATADLTSQFREAPQFYNSPECRTAAANWLSDNSAIHIAMTLDAEYLRGSMAAILSVVQHSTCPENVVFHFIVASKDNEFRRLIAFSFPYLRFRIYHFDTSTVIGRISTSIRPALDNPLNYARTYLADLLPHSLNRVVYLDSDLILVDDIAKLAAISLRELSVLAAPEYCNTNFTSYFTPSFWLNAALSMAFSGEDVCYFNTGVMVIDLKRWRDEDCTAKIEEWMELQKRMRIYELGSLPAFLLVFAGKITPVDHRWNQHGLGGDNLEGLCRNLHPDPVSLLHWSGKGKPWVRLDENRACPLDALWGPYDLYLTTFAFDL